MAERIAIADLKFAVYHKRLRALQAADQHAIDENLIAFVDLEGHVLLGSLPWRGLGLALYAHVRKPVIVVIVDNGLSVVRDVVLRIGLAFNGTHQRSDLFIVKSMVAFKASRSHQSLRSFIDRQFDIQTPWLTFIVILNLRVDPHLVEAIGAV